MLPNAFSVANGAVSIVATNQPFHLGQFISGRWTAGVLHGFGRCEYRYGYSELAFTLPKDGPGFWLAFWAESYQQNGHPHQEIDGFEWLGGQKPPSPGTTPFHFNLHDPAESSEPFGDRSHDYAFPADGKAHTVGFDWEPTFVKWYVDGRLVFTTGRSAAPNIPAGYMHPIISFAINGDWPAVAGTLVGVSTPFPAVWNVDYFRHYDWVSNGGVVLPGPGAGVVPPSPLPPVLDAVPVRLTACKATPDEGTPGQALALSCVYTSTIDQTVSVAYAHKDYISNWDFNQPYVPGVRFALKANVPQTVTIKTTFPGGPDTVTWDKIFYVVGDSKGKDITGGAPMWIVGIRAPVGRGADLPQIAYCPGRGQLALPAGNPGPAGSCGKP